MALDPARWGARIVVSPETSGNSAQGPAIAGLSGGGFAVVWPQLLDLAGIGDNVAVAGRVFDANGIAASAVFRVSDATLSDQTAPAIAATDSGFAVGFFDASRALTGFGSDVRLRAFDAAGTPLGAETVVNAGGPTEIFNQTQVSVAAGPGDRVLATFTDFDQRGPGGGGEDNFADGVRVRPFDGAAPAGADTLVNVKFPGDQAQSAIGYIPGSGFFAVWVDDLTSPGFGGRGTSIRGRLLDEAGAPVAGERILTLVDDFELAEPAVAGAPGGIALIAWEQDDAPGNDVDLNIWGTFYGGTPAEGALAGSPFLIAGGAGPQNEVAVGAVSDTLFAVVWTDRSGPPEIRGRLYDTAGAAVGDAFVIARDASFSNAHASVAPLDDGSGRFVVSWMTTQGTVLAQIFDIAAGLEDGLDFVGSDLDDVYAAQLGDLVLKGNLGDDSLTGAALDETIDGGDGNDTLNGGDGNDSLTGGTSTADLRDLLFGGAGDDTLDGGAGNDELRGDAGNDVLRGGFGVDNLFGGAGDDNINGAAWSDLVFGGAGADTVNGGFGFDRINGGAGADEFFHLGVADHGSDWIQDFSHAEGDTLFFGQAGATAGDFQVNFGVTGAAGAADVDEAFVVYLPTGQIVWALVDGAGNDALMLEVAGGGSFDLLA